MYRALVIELGCATSVGEATFAVVVDSCPVRWSRGIDCNVVLSFAEIRSLVDYKEPR